MFANEKQRFEKSKRVISVGIFVNSLLALIKLILGMWAHSIALTGDGIDSAVDVLKNIIGFQGMRIASRPPDKDHPYGHGRAETIVSNIIGLSVLIAGIAVLWSAVSSFGFGKVTITEQMMVVGATISIAGKIFLSRYMTKEGKKLSDPILMANAKDYLGDVVSSLAVLFGGLMIFLTGKAYFDNIASIIVSLIIMYMGFDVLRASVGEFMEKQENPEIESKIREVVKEIPGAFNPHLIRVRRLGSYYVVDMHLEFPKEMSVDESHAIMTDIEEKIKSQMPDVYDVTIHSEPNGK